MVVAAFATGILFGAFITAVVLATIAARLERE